MGDGDRDRDGDGDRDGVGDGDREKDLPNPSPDIDILADEEALHRDWADILAFVSGAYRRVWLMSLSGRFLWNALASSSESQSAKTLKCTVHTSSRPLLPPVRPSGGFSKAHWLNRSTASAFSCAVRGIPSGLNMSSIPLKDTSSSSIDTSMMPGVSSPRYVFKASRKRERTSAGSDKTRDERVRLYRLYSLAFVTTGRSFCPKHDFV